MDILELIGGLLLILVGANSLTDGAAAIAYKFKIPEIVIGLTIVAFGTSSPELIVSLSGAIKGSSDIAIGNIIGSNLFNTLLIVGITALVAPIIITKNTLRREIPLCILASVILFFISNDILIDGASSNLISRTEGIMLLALFLIFMSYTFAISKHKDKGEKAETGSQKKPFPIFKSVLFILGGLAALVFGGKIFIEGASNIALRLGVAESVIAITVVAIGTSIPELATSIVAALKKNPEIAIGNAIGSNLFNIFLVIGCTSTVKPLYIGNINNFDFISLIAASVLLWLVGVFYGKRTITRLEGSILTLCYIGYIVFLILEQKL